MRVLSISVLVLLVCGCRGNAAAPVAEAAPSPSASVASSATAAAPAPAAPAVSVAPAVDLPTPRTCAAKTPPDPTRSPDAPREPTADDLVPGKQVELRRGVASFSLVAVSPTIEANAVLDELCTFNWDGCIDDMFLMHHFVGGPRPIELDVGGDGKVTDTHAPGGGPSSPEARCLDKFMRSKSFAGTKGPGEVRFVLDAATARAGTVTVGAPVTTGDFTAGYVREAIRSELDEIRNCYRQTPPRKGSFTLSGAYTRSGEVTDVEVKPGTMTDGSVLDCLRLKLRYGRAFAGTVQGASTGTFEVTVDVQMVR